LWWNLDDKRLSARVYDLLGDPANNLILSVVSAWEIAIKNRLGKLNLPDPVQTYIPARLAHYHIDILPVSLAHALETASLPQHHGDPFDRLLIAQSRLERIPVVTADKHFKRYRVEVLW
jgi:PIN domain nuclease of toxin-antitoxin system